ncbi:MAG: YARHG domain-containing protein, partial [Alloprevotella sp.]|nr:YARHG domain-containing protein [Alloprevotella sp.]
MKRTLLSLLALTALTATQAQTLRTGDKYFDGRTLFTVQEVRMGTYIYMTGEDEGGNDHEMTLEKVPGQAGEYKLIPSRQADEPYVLMAEFGCRVQHVRDGSTDFLAHRRADGGAIHFMARTRETLQQCRKRQLALEAERPAGILQSTLLNQEYLAMIPREELRLMRNEILARHGYRFQSADLQEHFGGMAWYNPCGDNAAIRLSTIEQTNIELIRSEEALPGGLHRADVAGDV